VNQREGRKGSGVPLKGKAGECSGQQLSTTQPWGGASGVSNGQEI
jgi:hypothetical protein